MGERVSRNVMARRVAAELHRGQVVNLGIGLPTLVADHVSRGRGIIFHSENGLLGHGPRALEGEEDSDLVNACGEFITLFPGAAVISHTDALGMARGKHLDVAILDALQVSEKGDLATWMVVPQRDLAGPGGAIGIAYGAKRLIVITEHTTKDNALKILRKCTYPLIARGRVNLIVTDLAVIEVTPEGLLLKEVAPGWSAETVQQLTGAPLRVSSALKEMDFDLPQDQPFTKVYPSAAEAVAGIPDGAVILLDGFGGPGGMAHYLILALRDQGSANLTIIGNTAGIAKVSGFGAPPGFRAIDQSVLVENRQIRKAVASFPVSPSPSRPTAFEEAYRRGEVELEMVAQGTLAERLRAGGHGIAAFYTPTGVGTVVAQGKESRVINGREYILERAIRGDFALLRAHKADTLGNLVYRGTSRNFNPVMAMAATTTIAEVDEIVEPGELDPDAIVTPGLFVQRIVQRPADFFPFEPQG